MTPQADSPSPKQRYIVYATRGESTGNALGSALVKLEAEPGVTVDQVRGSRSAPRRLVITASPEVVGRVVQEFKGAIACERDLELKLDESHGYAPKPTDVPPRDGRISGSD